MRGYLSMSADTPTEGRRRVDPGAVVTIRLAVRVLDDAKDVRVVATIPDGWSVAGAVGGTVDRDRGIVTWGEGNLEADARVAETLRLRAPTRSPEGRPAFDTVLAAQLEQADAVLDAATIRLRVAPEIIVEHVTFALVDDVSQVPTYLAADAPLDGVGQMELFRVRFQVRNADLVRTVLTPRIEYRRAGDPAYAAVPADGPVQDIPFYLGTEWRPVAGGTLPGSDTETISPFEVREHDRDDDTQEPTIGRRLMRAAGATALALPGDSYTEVEFTVRTSLDLPFSETFQLRLVDGGRPITVATVAVVQSGPRPPLVLSPGQQNGVPVGPPVDAKPAAVSEVDFPLVTPAYVAAWPEWNATPRYRLAIALPTTPGTEVPNAAPFTSSHTPDVSLVSDTCASCHRAHVSQGRELLTSATPQSSLCFACHDGTGSNLNTKSQYTDPAVPANDSTTRSYYRHDATVPTTHTLAMNNEFGGVSNRHSECGDCHNPHNATAALSTQTTTGWTVAGQNATISGVSVTNGAAGTSPTYTFLDGTVGFQPTREYQVCFKCHSGFTTLPSNTGQPASRFALDKGVELNPANTSYHPVEAAGKNATAAMGLSLSGTSPYKQWSFATNSTIRCVNCHGDPRKYNATTPPAAGSDLAPHTSQYRGILIRNYRDRVLKSSADAYAAADSALCLVCHAEEPFLNQTSSATNFRLHEEHVIGLAGKGAGGTDIDTAGAGQGNAICAECHFRIHSTTYKVGTQGTYPRLINFAPNVLAYNGTLSWQSRTGGGSCTLVCHGKDHNGKNY